MRQRANIKKKKLYIYIYLSLVKCRIVQNLEVKFVKIPREENIDSEQMAKAASSMWHKHR